MKKLPNFQNFLNEENYQSINENKISFDGMSFMTSIFNDSKGLAIQFTPFSATLNKFSKNEQVDAILNRLKKSMPEFASSLWFESGGLKPGLVFRIDTSELNDIIVKNLK